MGKAITREQNRFKSYLSGKKIGIYSNILDQTCVRIRRGRHKSAYNYTVNATVETVRAALYTALKGKCLSGESRMAAIKETCESLNAQAREMEAPS